MGLGGEGRQVTLGVTKKILSTKNASNSSGGGDLNGCFPRVLFARLHVRENVSH